MEVVVSTTILALMIVSLLSFVQFASILWRKGEQTIMIANNSRMVMEALNRDCYRAVAIRYPRFSDGQIGSLTIDVPISTGTYNGTGTIKFEVETGGILWKRLTDFSGSGGIAGALADEDAPQEIYRGRYEYPVARDVTSFTVTRLSSWTINVALSVRSEVFSSDADVTEFGATSTFLMPGVE